MSFPRTVFTAVALIATCALPGFLVAGLAPDIGDELGLSEDVLGIAFAVFWGAGAVTAGVGGRFAQKVGWVRGIQLAAAVSTTSAITIGLLAHSPVVLIAALAFGGLANGVGVPSAALMLAEQVGKERQGLSFGIGQAGAPSASLVAGLALPLVAAQLGWRAAFAGAAAASVIVAVSVSRAKPAKSATESEPDAKAPLTAGLVTLTIAAALGTTAAGAANGFLVVSAVDAGYAKGTAGALLAVASVLTVATRVGLGLLSDRPRTPQLLFTATMLAAGAVGFALLSRGDPVLFAIGAMLSSAAGWGWLGLFSYAIVQEHREAPAAATGVAQTGLLTGGCLGPLVFGFLAHQISFQVAWMVTAAIGMAAAVTMLLGRALLVRGRRRQAIAERPERDAGAVAPAAVAVAALESELGEDRELLPADAAIGVAADAPPGTAAGVAASEGAHRRD